MFIDSITDFRSWRPRSRLLHFEQNDQINPNMELIADEEYDNRVAIPAGAEDDDDVVNSPIYPDVNETEWFSDDFSVWDYYDEGEDALTDISNGDYIDHEDDYDGEDDFGDEDDFDGEDDFDVDEDSDDSLPAIELHVPYNSAHSSNISVNDWSSSSASDDLVLPIRNTSPSLRNSAEDLSFTSSVPEADHVTTDREFLEQENGVQMWSNELQKHWTEDDECWDST